MTENFSDPGGKMLKIMLLFDGYEYSNQAEKAVKVAPYFSLSNHNCPLVYFGVLSKLLLYQFKHRFGDCMLTIMTVKGQVTIPKQIRDALGLLPGAKVDMTVNQNGEVVLRPEQVQIIGKEDRFEAARGKADIHWRTEDLMALLRGED